ncbi:MAG TPA: hypothetical protein VGQ41_19315 [Pyrinomonadaceae bacterium]|nr:hypothetical protein [Pyrinomonadaceae bacterium]
MHINPNMDRESPPLDSEDWDIVFAAYAEYPILAFILAQHLHSIRELVQRGPEDTALAIAGLDRAIESLMPHTTFRDAGRKVYLMAVTGTLSTEQEAKLRELGLLE